MSLTRIIITLFIARLLVTSCWADELKADDKKPPFHIYLSFDDGPLGGSEDIDAAVKIEKININVFWEETELKKLIESLRSSGFYEFNHLSEYPRQQVLQ
ncbi:MAG: hypothetical protein WAU61_03960 [Smithella sp.]